MGPGSYFNQKKEGEGFKPSTPSYSFGYRFDNMPGGIPSIEKEIALNEDDLKTVQNSVQKSNNFNELKTSSKMSSRQTKGPDEEDSKRKTKGRLVATYY